MKICFVGPAESSHIIKWCTWFSNNGHEVHVVSFESKGIPNTSVHFVDVGVSVYESDAKKIKYLFAGKEIKRIINNIKPDIINVHYATSYGAAVAISGIKKYVLSVWGADIYDFPQKSPFHKALLKYSLKKASYLFSTSEAMALEAQKYTDKKIFITPFGVDMSLFNPDKRNRNLEDTDIIVGTVKCLSDKYGIRFIIEAVAAIKKNTKIPIKLRIAGTGPNENEYHNLAKKLEIDDITTWLGFISQEEAAKEWANMDIALIPSVLDSESFGVAAVEAEASGTAVIISDVPGLMEATKPNLTSIVVKRASKEALYDGILMLARNRYLRESMGVEGRNFSKDKFELEKCFVHIEAIYEKILEESLQ